MKCESSTAGKSPGSRYRDSTGSGWERSSAPPGTKVRSGPVSRVPPLAGPDFAKVTNLRFADVCTDLSIALVS